jgi:hypothetical protein
LVRSKKKTGKKETVWDIAVLAYADDVNLLGDNTDAIKKKL